MMSELTAGPLFENELYEQLTHRAVLECNKWNLAAGDRPITCRYPLVVSTRLWRELGDLAEALARESDAAERELLSRPELYSRLGLPKLTATCLQGLSWSNAPRYTRFDFHTTPDGLRITESNCDVAGGLLESSGVGAILASLLGRPPPEDPAGALVDAFARRFGTGAKVGLMHLAEYSEDRQVVLYLARRFEERGLKPWLFHPAQLRAELFEEVDAVYRFIPGDWLEQLPTERGWRALFSSDRVSNPLSTLLTQSKRFPLVWSELRSATPTWQHLLPETKPLSEQRLSEWVLKPAFGHEGANIVIDGVTSAKVASALWRRARRAPLAWVTQRRFEVLPLETPEGPRFACVGVFIIDGKRAGSYARLSETPIIDGQAQEAVVFVRDT